MSSKKLDTNSLLTAYSTGLFPMPHPKTEEIEWFFPDPRAILPLNGFHCSRSLKKKMRNELFEVTIDQDFKGVMQACAEREETWINSEFIRAYGELQRMGYAHSLEVWHGGQLVGGVYGVAIFRAFFAESMFHTKTDASKIALYHLTLALKKSGFKLLEVQFITPHLKSLGAIEISADEYLTLLEKALDGKILNLSI